MKPEWPLWQFYRANYRNCISAWATGHILGMQARTSQGGSDGLISAFSLPWVLLIDNAAGEEGVNRAGFLSMGTSGPSHLPMPAGPSSFPDRLMGLALPNCLCSHSVFLSRDFEGWGAAYLRFRKS